MIQAINQKNSNNISFYCDANGNTWCYLLYKGNKFIGHAKCLPEDQDFQSERTGCFIAECKATIKKLKFIRSKLNIELIPLINFKKSLECCKNYNPNSFEAKKLRKEIYFKQKQINELNSIIKDEQNYLNKYIAEKDNLYHKLRARGQK